MFFYIFTLYFCVLFFVYPVFTFILTFSFAIVETLLREIIYFMRKHQANTITGCKFMIGKVYFNKDDPINFKIILKQIEE